MRLTIPVYVEQERKNDGMFFTVRPLFTNSPVANGEHLNRVLTRLSGRLTSTLAEIVRNPNHEDLLPYTYSPTFADRTLDVPVSLREKTVNLKVLLVLFDALERTVVFSPQVPGPWFTIEGEQTLRDRASEVYSQYFRQLAKKSGSEKDFTPENLALKGKAWVTTVDIYVASKQRKAPPEKPFAFLGMNKVPEGQSELQKVGRCLDWQYPDELDRSLFRDKEVAQLTRLIDDHQSRPVLIVGPAGVGKTALIHEALFRRIQTRGKPGEKQNIWLLSPQRMISGMSYVGQWENRVLAILDAAKDRKHTLYFDDLIGLFHAGQTSQSQLSIAHVLKPYMERRDVRVLAEITPEGLRVLQEVDRGFADLFQIVRVREPAEEETVRILIRIQQQLEGKHRAAFNLDCLPAVLDVQRRYCRDIAFPGKAASFLSQLAVKFAKKVVTRENVLQEFQRKSGLSLNLLDARQKLTREQVVEAIGARIIGQHAAVEAFADAISVAKARLNDPGKPLSVFLFLGPTGVGKTQCAKALAEYLFGSSERMVRFDLNEFVNEDAVSRLAGTVWNPEGLLTSAVRRQPFSVLLLDEIEKAHPSVFDLLLQVLGEGRLSDARGRTVDFTNTIVIMTSNLGVQEAYSTLGLKRADKADPSVYVRAAERFFRPEYFNRIDRILPFERLTRAEIGRIAKLLIEDVFKREGLTRRKCLLDIHPAALEKVTDAGYHPELGARALKRAIERQLTRPVAEYLASIAPETPAVISLYPSGDGIAVNVTPIEYANALPDTQRRAALRFPAAAILEKSYAALKRLENVISGARPPGEISTSPEYQHYFALREALTRLKNAAERLDDALNPPKGRRAVHRAHPRPRMGRLLGALAGDGLRRKWAALFTAQDVNAFMREFTEVKEVDSDLLQMCERCVIHASYIDAMALVRQSHRIVVALRPIAETTHMDIPLKSACRLLKDAYGSIGGLDSTELSGLPGEFYGFLIEGFGARLLTEGEDGLWLHHVAGSGLAPIQVLTFALNPGEEPATAVQRACDAREEWQRKLGRGEARASDDPFKLRPVLRILDERGNCVDLRTDATTPETAEGRDLRHFICGVLPPSQEFGVDSDSKLKEAQ